MEFISESRGVTQQVVNGLFAEPSYPQRRTSERELVAQRGSERVRRRCAVHRFEHSGEHVHALAELRPARTIVPVHLADIFR